MSEDLLAHIDRLIQQRPVSKEALAPFREFVLLMVQAMPEIKPISIEKNVKEIKHEEGFPIFSREDLPLDFESASALLVRFFEHLAESNRNDKKGLKKALQKSKRNAKWPLELFKTILKQDEKAMSKIQRDIDLDEKVLQFVGQMAMRPSLQALRSVLLKEKIETWDYGYCPVCGSQPDIGYFTKTGQRFLHCELCGEEWPYPRLKCPFCSNEDQNTMGYFQAEAEEGFRVYFCRKCQRYIKTIDKKVFEVTAPMELENLATIHLDMLATQNGFK